MASIKDAFEESIQDHNAILKYIIFAIPVFYCVNLYEKFSANSSTFMIVAGFTYLLLFGFMIKCTSNVQKGGDRVLPSFNIFSMLWDGIKGTVALGPLFAVCGWAAIYISGWIESYIPASNVLIAFKFVIGGLFASITLTGYLCYAKHFRIPDAYNLKIISDSCADIFIAVIFMIPQIILADAIILIPVSYIIWLFWGIPSPIAIFFWCIVSIFTIAMTAHYLAQLSYENITTKENSEKLI